MIKNYIIMGKGFVNKIVADPFLKGMEVADVEYRYGQIRLKTTKKKLEEFVDNLIDNEQDFKVIDYFEENSKEHRLYMYGPDEMFNLKNLKQL